MPFHVDSFWASAAVVPLSSVLRWPTLHTCWSLYIKNISMGAVLSRSEART